MINNNKNIITTVTFLFSVYYYYVFYWLTCLIAICVCVSPRYLLSPGFLEKLLDAVGRVALAHQDSVSNDSNP